MFINNLDFEDNFYFGQKFFELFEITEFDLHTNDINLYMDKNKDYIIEKKIIKKISKILILILLLLFSFYY